MGATVWLYKEGESAFGCPCHLFTNNSDNKSPCKTWWGFARGRIMGNDMHAHEQQQKSKQYNSDLYLVAILKALICCRETLHEIAFECPCMCTVCVAMGHQVHLLQHVYSLMFLCFRKYIVLSLNYSEITVSCTCFGCLCLTQAHPSMLYDPLSFWSSQHSCRLKQLWDNLIARWMLQALSFTFLSY